MKTYKLDLTYDPSTDVLVGMAVLVSRATQGLSAFNLDFHGLTVRSITVDGRPAIWTRAAEELTVIPAKGVGNGRWFSTVVRYDGVPKPITTPPSASTGGSPPMTARWSSASCSHQGRW